MAESSESPQQPQHPQATEPPKAPESAPFDERHYRNVLGALSTAFDVDSNGMGVVAHALDALVKSQELTHWQEAALVDVNSNYFIHQYVLLWMKDKDQLTPNEKLLFSKLGPKNKTPRSEQHVVVYRAAQQEYKTITETIIRQALLENGNLEVLYKSYKPMTVEEFSSLRESAAKRGVIEIYEPNESYSAPPRSIGVFLHGKEYGIRTPDKLSQYIADMPFFGLLKEKTKRAATLKLGAMLGLTEQLTYDAKMVGRPISHDYQPDEAAYPVLKQQWQERFGEPMPVLADLYAQSHEVFRQNTRSDDPVAGYLHNLTSLPHLAP